VRQLLAGGLALACGWLLGCGDSEAGSPHAPPPRREQASPAREAPARGPENLILITLDTTRADALNPYGQMLVTSPNIDRMAREGVLFEQVASSSPSTLPAHATLLTGQYPPAHGVRSNSGYRLPAAVLTLAEILQSRGYRTGAEIAAPVLDAARGLVQGFEQYRDTRSHEVETIEAASEGAAAGDMALEERPASDITRFGKRFLDAHANERFFLWLHYFDPHLFHVRRPEYARQIPDDGYLAEVLYTDDQLGHLLAHLEAKGLRERTLVVVVADHGEGRGEHDERTHAFFLYETTIRVPLLLWGPKSLPAGTRVRSLVRTVDVLPTVLELLGIPLPGGLSGRSLRPLLDAPERDPGLSAYSESVEFSAAFRGAPLRSLRRGPWKYIHQVEPELYHLGDDPNERVNLASAHPDRVRALREELEVLVRGIASRGDAAAIIDASEREALAALGYVVADEDGIDEALLSSLELFGPTPQEMARDVEKLSLATGKERLGDFEQALVIFEELVGRHPESAYLLSSYGEVLVKAGRREDARAALERAVALAHCGARQRILLGELLRSTGERNAQHEVLKLGVERCPDMPELLNNYAFVLATSPVDSLRDGEQAVAVAHRAIDAHGGAPAEILDTLAAAQAESGDFEAAEATLVSAIEAARARPPAMQQLLETNLALVRKRQPLRDE
jgi:arylsulfatase A-like enzyme/Flp pilus assembly protein TadD